MPHIFNINQSKKNLQSHKMRSEVFPFRGRKPQGLLSDASARKLCKRRSSCYGANFIEEMRGET